ncbi:MAG: xanthine dehydrogenase family protein molybdopterin-binding subunit [Acidobacteria bacterium]|nr:xanthine dehydrogenase family protein molybdopterin-binding subunit [Acidobacteriota bacterium]
MNSCSDVELRVVGANLPRKDAIEKVTGQALYSTEVSLPGMLHAKVLRSPRAHARIRSIDVSAAETAPGVHAVLTHADIPKHFMPVYGYFIKDQPLVAVDHLRYVGDIVCAVAAESEAAAVEALARIRVDYEDLPVAASIGAALAPEAAELFPEAPPGIVPAYGDGASAILRPGKNICYQFNYTTGPPSAFERCDHVFEDTFHFSRMHHYHLEPFVTVAEARADRINLWSACQNPFPLRKELARMFKVPENRITVNVPFIGAGFGAKNNCKTEPVAVMLAMMTGRPVRFCLTMEESFLTNTQHAAILKLRTGVMADGRFVARESDIWLDAGAYSDASPLVAEKAGYRIPGPYRWKHIDTRCYCVMTNTSPAGPFRGFGGTQTTWAGESQLDMIARRLGIDPYEMRLKNLLKLGEPFVPGESGIDSDLKEGLDLVAREVGYFDYRKSPPKPKGVKARGVGLSIGFKDGGGVNKPAQARIKVSTNGDIYLHCGTVEIGQGARTALAAFAAEILCAPYERVSLPEINTDYLPFDQGTNASSAIAVMGQAVACAADSVKKQVLEFAASQLECPASELVLDNWTIRQGEKRHPMVPMIMRYYGGTGFEFTGEGYYKAPSDHHAPLEAPCVFWEIGWGGVEVEVDTETGQVKILRLVMSGDTGRSVNPLVCRGQEDGAAVMGIAQTLFERMIYNDAGQLLNNDPLVYRVPLAEDVPASFRSITQEQGHGPGPFGAKGAGEATILPVASAVANAIEDATGARITELPITPERVLEALTRQQAK